MEHKDEDEVSCYCDKKNAIERYEDKKYICALIRQDFNNYTYTCYWKDIDGYIGNHIENPDIMEKRFCLLKQRYMQQEQNKNKR